MIVTVIRLRVCGLMARFDVAGRLVEWTEHLLEATHFPDLVAAEDAIRGITAPEVRAAIRAGFAAVVEDEETGEVHVVDAHDHQELYPTPRIRLAVGPRFLDDDPSKGVPRAHGRADRAERLVRMLFREAPRLNWKHQTSPGFPRTPDEYVTPMKAKARHAGALASYLAQRSRVSPYARRA